MPPKKDSSYGLHYVPNYLSVADRRKLVHYVGSLRPIWEMRYHAADAGEDNRQLLRPVYWLGAWQFACLDYYRPPHGTQHRCVRSDGYPPFLAHILHKVERQVRSSFRPSDVPKAWKLNTCLVNYYGDRLGSERKEDLARVGEHRDFEPGPVASLSLGERAVFQFVRPGRRGERSQVVLQQWLEDGSLQVFGGPRWKDTFFHRVQRVERKSGFRVDIGIPDFAVRRVNLTFRYVPEEHIFKFGQLSHGVQAKVREYMEELAKSSSVFRKQLPTKPAL